MCTSSSLELPPALLSVVGIVWHETSLASIALVLAADFYAVFDQIPRTKNIRHAQQAAGSESHMIPKYIVILETNNYNMKESNAKSLSAKISSYSRIENEECCDIQDLLQYTNDASLSRRKKKSNN